MSELTLERLSELRRIAEAATPGPWTATHSDGDCFKLVGADDVSIIDGCGCCGSPWLDGIDPDADARFFAEFHREQVLAMLYEIERLRRAVEAATRMAEILRGLEWSGWDERFRAHMCPVCGGYKSKNKHFPDCNLNKALSFLRDVGRE